MRADGLILRLRRHAADPYPLMSSAAIAFGTCTTSFFFKPLGERTPLQEDLLAAADLLEKLTDPTGIDELGLSVRAYNALYRRGYRLAREIAEMSAKQLAQIPGIGIVTAQEIERKVREGLE